ncbi:MAG TPA: diphosphomevalonate decarboxylase [Anaerolineales bacterium]|nr:diphosphomevalonate decarboxylase [Anaerolineales bacterium]
MPDYSATGVAFANIAFIKYWGNRDPILRIPANGSISMNLQGLTTRTQVTFAPDLPADQLTMNRNPTSGAALQRVSQFLDYVRRISGMQWHAQVESENNFPTGAGIASSASAFAALSLAASRAAGLELSEAELSRLARRGSGSACRSVPGGFVEWQAGNSDQDSYAYSLAPADHWNLVDCVTIVSQQHKETGSFQGHDLAHTSPLHTARLSGVEQRLTQCRQAILQRDFDSLAQVMELDSNLMHAVMITQNPPLLYWQPATLAVMHAVQEWRKQGLAACYTIDAGPNVHVICPAENAAQVHHNLSQIPGVQKVLSAAVGGPAWYTS